MPTLPVTITECLLYAYIFISNLHKKVNVRVTGSKQTLRSAEVKLFSQSDIAIKWLLTQVFQSPESVLFPCCHAASKCI